MSAPQNNMMLIKKNNMPSPAVYLLNSPVLTAYGQYDFIGPISVEQVQAALAKGFVSAVGHVATAQLLTQLLCLDVTVQRLSIQLAVGESAIVFRMKKRLPEGFIVSSLEQLKNLPYEFSLLKRLG